MTGPDLGPGPEIEDLDGGQTQTLTPVRRERGETRRGGKRRRRTGEGIEEVEAEVDREDETEILNY